MNENIKTLIKFSNFTNSVYNFNNNSSKSEKMASRLLTEEIRHVGRWSRGNASHVRQETQVMWECDYVTSHGTLSREHISTQEFWHVSSQDTSTHEYVNTQGTWARRYTRHVGTWAVSTQGTLAREHVSTQGTLAREHVSTQGTLAHEHVSTENT